MGLGPAAKRAHVNVYTSCRGAYTLADVTKREPSQTYAARKARGRPLVSLSMTDETLRQMDEMARASGLSRSGVVGETIRATFQAMTPELRDEEGCDRLGKGGGVLLLPPTDVEEVLRHVTVAGLRPKVTMLDPWYGKGTGGVRPDYRIHILRLLKAASELSPHVFLWGFPETVAPFVERLPKALSLNAWLTWHYPNNPSVIRGWRSAQMTCLHLVRDDAVLYPEHFLSRTQLDKKAAGKLRYMPGPASVISSPLIIGFVGKNEQTGHPSQKPVAVFEPLFRMTTKPGDLVLDPMAGSGTTGAVARALGLRAVLNDVEPKYVDLMEARLGVERIADSSLRTFGRARGSKTNR